MYYVLFNYIKKHAKGWLPFTLESNVIKFLHESYEDIEVVQIIEVKTELRLGLVVTEDYIKSTLEPEEEDKRESNVVSLSPSLKEEEILRQNKKTLEELEAGEPSAISKLAEDIEEEMKEDELTDEEKAREAMDDANALIEREKKREEQKKKGWKLCTKCNSNRVAPWNEKGICSPCQGERKTNRPYIRSKDFLSEV